MFLSDKRILEVNKGNKKWGRIFRKLKINRFVQIVLTVSSDKIPGIGLVCIFAIAQRISLHNI